MKNQQTAFFLEIQEIPENSPIFDELQKEELFFSYFQVDQNYYLFFLRSLRGFFLYALETMENGKDLEILRTNLQSSFWRKLKRILRQNKKAVLLEFLFGSQGSTLQTHLTKELEEKIQIFKN